MAMHPTVEKHLDDIRAAAERYGVDKLEIFGSAMTDDFDVDRSDVDFIVHYPQGYDYGVFLKRYLDFEDELTAILDRPAQLVMTSALTKKRFRKSAEQTRMTVYAKSTSNAGTGIDTRTLSVHP